MYITTQPWNPEALIAETKAERDIRDIRAVAEKAAELLDRGNNFTHKDGTELSIQKEGANLKVIVRKVDERKGTMSSSILTVEKTEDDKDTYVVESSNSSELKRRTNITVFMVGNEGYTVQGSSLESQKFTSGGFLYTEEKRMESDVVQNPPDSGLLYPHYAIERIDGYLSAALRK